MKIMKLFILALLMVFSFFFFGALSYAATISGTVYQSDGLTPLNGANLRVVAYTGNPCGQIWEAGSGTVDSYNGNYTMTNLHPGTYYLRSDHMNQSDYVNEWWSSAGSTQNCTEAQPIQITSASQAVTGKNFQLDLGGSISGTVYQSDGTTPVTGVSLLVGLLEGDPCGYYEWKTGVWTNSTDGSYTVRGVQPGTYHLQSYNGNQSDYVNEWWAASSTSNCSAAQAVEISSPGQAVTGKNFQLDLGGSISGTVYQSDGITPVTGVTLDMPLWQGNPCGDHQWKGTAGTNPSDGSYVIRGIPPGTYYLSSNNMNQSDHVNEWWAFPSSTVNCGGAQAVEITTPGQSVTGKNFQLELGGSISGAVYQSDGITPVTGVNINITANQGSPCSSYQGVAGIWANQADGTFILRGLSPGMYYLRSDNMGHSDYVNEWWAASSTSNCSAAQAVEISSPGQAVTGKNFQLDLGGSISGTVYQSDGTTPITGVIIHLDAVSGTPCGARTNVAGSETNPSNGTYTVRGVPLGSYYLWTNNLNQSDYVNEWWGSSTSTNNCGGAQAVEITTPGQAVTGKNFQLELGGSISGTVYQSDGTTPVTGVNIDISAIQGSPCSSYQGVAGIWANQADGTYVMRGLPPGTYYLHSHNMNQSDYLDEWWASPSSTADCSGAQAIEITTPGQAVTGKNFQLDLGGSISGTVYQSNGTTPVTGVSVYVVPYQGDPCGSRSSKTSVQTNSSNGSYIIRGVPQGIYYLHSTTYDQSDYVDEWWASPSSTADCSGAQTVEITTPGQAVTGKNFQLDLGGSISGTVYQSDGATPVTGVNIDIIAVQGNPCSSFQFIAGIWANQVDGTFILRGLPTGTYYLRSYGMGEANYATEWWASPSSTFNCSGAQAVVISSPSQAVTGRNFQLELGGGISGQVTGDNGPIQGMFVTAYSGKCWSGWLGNAQTDKEGNYHIERLPPIPVYVVVQAENSHLNYVAEWQNDAVDCQAATPVTIVSGENQPEIDFTLSRGPKRLRSYEVVVGNGDLSVFFMVEPAFRDGLISATLTTPNAARGTGGIYTFDLAKDKLLWTSECRYIDGWAKGFGPVQPADYGTYTLTLQFQDGAQEAYTYPIQDVPITAVSDISVTVNDSGSVRVTWNRNTTSDGYYEVRVKALGDGTEIFKSQAYKNYQELNIPASSLSCLEIGKTYRWLVRVYDNIYPLYSKSATQYVEVPYSPGNFTNRYAYASAAKRPEGLYLEFNTRSGSKENVKSIVVTGASGFNYSFDLVSDWVDISTETRLSVKGWYKQDPAWPVTDGTYTFTVQYDDDLDGDTDQTEVITRQLTVNAMNPFETDRLGALIYADGAMGFRWGLTGVPGLRYQVRIRSLDGTEEYYSSSQSTDATSVTANFSDLRAMKRGEMYQWFVRAYSADGDTMEQSGSQNFYYDPAPDYDATKATFNANSAAITYPYTSSRVGDKLIYAGTGAFAGFGRYIEALAIEQVEGINCLKFLVKGAGRNPDPELDPEWYHLWLAQDTQGNVWVLQAYDGHSATMIFSGLSHAAMWMPVSPVAGQVFRQIGDQYTQVQKTGVGVTLGTGLGPYDNCLKLIENRLGDLDVIYLAPGAGIVKEEWNDGGTNNGWELQEIIRARAFKDELILDFGPSYGLYHYDKTGGWKQWNTVNPSQVVTIDLNGDGMDELVAAFAGYGLYKKDSANDWHRINDVVPDKMIPADIDGDGDDELIAAFAGYGLYYYDDLGGWSLPINDIIPDAMVRYSEGMVCDFGAAYGLWSYNTSVGWAPLNAEDPDRILAADIDGDGKDELVVSFVGWGLYIYDPASGTWQQPPINTVMPDQIIAVDIDGDDNDELVASFPGYGLYTYEPEDGTWDRINTEIPEGMIRQGNGLAVDFGAAYGLWVWSQGGGWQPRNTADPGQMVAVDIDNDGVEELVVAFTGYGLYYHNETNGWQFLNGVIPEDMKPVNFYP